MVPLRFPTLIVAITLTTALAISPGAMASECVGNTIVIQVGVDTIYLDDSGHEGGAKHQAIYLESNPQPGLQRGGAGALSGQTFPFLFIGFCVDSANPDTRLYP